MIRGLIATVAGAAGAVIASQAPGFTQQYMQNLEGRVDELRIIVERFDAKIAAIGYDRARAEAECATAELLLGALCEGITQDIARYERLSAHRTALLAAEPWQRPIVLARTADRDVAESAYRRFEPAVPATASGAGYAGAGFAVFWSVLTLLTAPFGRRRRRYA